MNVSVHFMNKIRNSTPDEKYLEDEDLNGLEKLLKDSQVVII